MRGRWIAAAVIVAVVATFGVNRLLTAETNRLHLPTVTRDATATVAPTAVVTATAGGLSSGAPSAAVACPADPAEPLFTILPIATADFMAFRPLGFMAPPIHMFPAKHSAFSMTPPGQAAVPRTVVAPGRMWVGEIWVATFSTGGGNYQVFTYPCRDVRIYWGHIATIGDKLAAAQGGVTPTCNSFPDGTATVTTCRHTGLSVLLEAGEAIGTGPDSAGIDLGVIDFRRTPAAFIERGHYDAYYPYYASPLDYFIPSVRAAIEAKTGSVFGKRFRTAVPIGGTYMQDVPGTARGNWFSPGKYHRNTTDLSPSLGLATDFVDPAQPVIAIGSSVPGMTMGLYAFTPRSTGTINRDFADVRADGSIHCYEAFLGDRTPGEMPLTRPSGVLLLAMTGDTTLKVEHVPGATCPADSARTFSASAAPFER
jgi:hypothetical protein